MGTLSSIMSAPALNLYRRILRLHRWKLPQEMRHLGDSYVKEEFRLHRTANATQVEVFMQEWQNYAGQLDSQSTDFGQEMHDDDVTHALSSLLGATHPLSSSLRSYSHCAINRTALSFSLHSPPRCAINRTPLSS